VIAQDPVHRRAAAELFEEGEHVLPSRRDRRVAEALELLDVAVEDQRVARTQVVVAKDLLNKGAFCRKSSRGPPSPMWRSLRTTNRPEGPSGMRGAWSKSAWRVPSIAAAYSG
jgi:hypothetical protein